MPIVFLLAFFLAGTGAVSADVPADSATGGMALVSPAFRDGDAVPRPYTCHGADISPPLHIDRLPPGTKSLALTVHDPDGVTGTWVHWVVFNIPPHLVDIAEKAVPGVEALNDFGNFYYGGPCPPDRKVHHYVFTVYALGEVLAEVDEGATMDTLLRSMRGKILGQATLTGTFQNIDWR